VFTEGDRVLIRGVDAEYTVTSVAEDGWCTVQGAGAASLRVHSTALVSEAEPEPYAAEAVLRERVRELEAQTRRLRLDAEKADASRAAAEVWMEELRRRSVHTEPPGSRVTLPNGMVARVEQVALTVGGVQYLVSWWAGGAPHRAWVHSDEIEPEGAVLGYPSPVSSLPEERRGASRP
jgi:hypothetical protein